MSRKNLILFVSALILMALTYLALHQHFHPVLTFLLSAAALILIAMIVGLGPDQLGSRLGPGMTGVVQSALGNLPELFVCIFALRAGLDQVVQAALVGSILANSLLVFGLALFLGGLKHGTQTFHSIPPRMNATMMFIAFSALAIPTLSHTLHTQADAHINTLV